VKEDNRALLTLLLERGQSYDDIAGVLGTDRDAVRRRAVEALEDLSGRRTDPELADYLLGEAAPVERADMARRLSADEAEASRAADLAGALREIAPQADLPTLPEAHRPPLADDRVAPPAREEERASGAPAWVTRGRLGIAAAVLVVLLVALIVIVTGDFGGDEPSRPAQPSVEELDAVPVELAPSGGSEASGEAILGLATADQPFVDVELQGLEPLSESDAYILWLMAGEQRGWPLGLIAPDQRGSHSDRYPVPSFLLSTEVIEDLSSIVISRSPRAAALEAADEAAKSGVPEVDFVGEVVASGDVPESGEPAPRGG
jgi:hypothetical protein